MKRVGVGLIGFGTVGTGVVRAFQENGELISERTGIHLDLVRIADIDFKSVRSVSVDKSMLVNDANMLFSDDKIQVVVELIGGLSPAKEFILKALKAGKHVVTANKELLAHHGAELMEASKSAEKHIYFEASVGGGIPIIKALRESFAGNRVNSIYGIVNGTANYILTKMLEEGKSFEKVLLEAQKKGFAEVDASFDVDGIDSAHKLIILNYLAHNYWIDMDSIYIEGIRAITNQDILYAKELGFSLKLLAVSKKEKDCIDVRIHPAMLDASNPLSSVNGVFNAFWLEGDFIGESMLYGRGAGGNATASAVISDIVDASRSIIGSSSVPSIQPISSGLKLKNIEDLWCRCYIRFMAVDRPGVLAHIAGILGKYEISIDSMLQKGKHKARAVPIVMMTHKAFDNQLLSAIH
ncbi:MAG: homoserine dehydrogenase, partial [Candidatus Theseobacter exili]|nr:homoserine dehydrogenase [Candidatus Theseobacter exili]